MFELVVSDHALPRIQVCAVATHVFVLHSSPAPAAVLLALNAMIVYLRRDELVTLAIKAQSGQRQYPS